jgi:isopenicillin-N epimerase
VSQHASLPPERWRSFRLDQQILMIGNEMNRASGLMGPGDEASRRLAYERVLNLVDLTAAVHSRRGLLRELLRWRDLAASLYTRSDPDPAAHAAALRALLLLHPESAPQAAHLEAAERARLAGHWMLDPAVRYLNHGSFGACPRAILDFQADLRAELEREPVDFLYRRLSSRLAEARGALGAFIGADPEGLVFLHNATTGVNAALRAWDLKPGDEILTTDHAYGACRKALELVARRRRARVVVARVPFPLRSPDDVVEAVLAALTRRTRLALLDHVTSPTALVFPIEALVRTLRERGIETIVDGAHALGMLPLVLDRLGAACYTANAHKWLCAPKGAAFLHVRRDRLDRIRPLVVSHGYDPAGEGVRFRDEWDWTGTLDPTPWLAIPECVRFLGGLLPGGWPALMERNHDLALRARGILLESLGLPAPCPGGMIGAMASLPLPAAGPESPLARLDPDALTAWTRDRGFEPIFFPWACPGGKVVRVSAQVYNHEEQYRAFAPLLAATLRAGPGGS